MGNFKELRVWRDAIALAKEIYALSRKKPFANDYGLCNQIQRAAVSIASNIAEGDERGTNKEAIRFFHIAKASGAEVITQLEIAYQIGYLDEEICRNCEDKVNKIKASLNKLIKARSMYI